MPKPQKQKRVITKVFYPIYRVLFKRFSFDTQVRKSLMKSNKSVNAEIYLSKALAYSLPVGLLFWVIGFAAVSVLRSQGIIPKDITTGVNIQNETLLQLTQTLETPLILGGSAFIAGGIGFVLVFSYFLFKPRLDANARSREINALLPDAISFMYALSIGGLNQIEILQSIANADNTYGEVSEEFKIILNETQRFDSDYRNAIKDHAAQTPSKQLSRFLSDMLSILNTGGDIESFLADKRRKYIRQSKKKQEQTLETLELFGEMYMTLSLFPLLLIIMLVIMGIMGSSQTLKLAGTVYGMIPLTGLAFLVLISTVKQDDTGSGILVPTGKDESEVVNQKMSLSYGTLLDSYDNDHTVFSNIRRTEQTNVLKSLLKSPHIYFRDNPLHTLVFTVPLSITIVTILVLNGALPTSIEGLQANVITGTFGYFYLPSYLIGIPLAVFHEWRQSYENSVMNDFSETLRKLANANDIGLTLFEAFDQVSQTAEGRLADEFEIIHKKVQYGMSLEEALIEFNNKYQIPRLSRTIKLITKAQKASNQITEVLVTAAEASETQDDIIDKRKQQARMQVAIIIMTYITLLAVMVILQIRFIGVMAELVTAGGGGSSGPGSQFAASIDVDFLSLLFFHAVTLQGAISGLISGYMRDAKILSGAKFLVILQTIALIAWIFVV